MQILEIDLKENHYIQLFDLEFVYTNIFGQNQQ